MTPTFVVRRRSLYLLSARLPSSSRLSVLFLFPVIVHPTFDFPLSPFRPSHPFLSAALLNHTLTPRRQIDQEKHEEQNKFAHCCSFFVFKAHILRLSIQLQIVNYPAFSDAILQLQLYDLHLIYTGSVRSCSVCSNNMDCYCIVM